MKSNIFKILLVICLLSIGQFAVAQPNTDTTLKSEVVSDKTFKAGAYELISPIGNLNKVEDQSANGFSDFVNLIIRIAIALAGAFAVITIIISGIQYMGSDSVWEKGESKSRMTAAIGGLILLFCSYLILYTVNPDLVNIKIGGMKLSEGEWDNAPVLKSDGTYTAPPKSSGAKGCAGGKINGEPITKNTVWPVAEQKIFIDELKTKNIITTSSSGSYCMKVDQQRCTAMYFNPGTKTIVKDKLIKLQQKAGENITVTGGSECWLHSTHGPDDTAIDLQVTPALTKAITGSDSFPSNKWVEVPGIGKFLAEGVGGSAKNTGKHWHAVLK